MSRRLGKWPLCAVLVALQALSPQLARAEPPAKQATTPALPAIVFVRGVAAGFEGMAAQLGELEVRVVEAAPLSNLSLASQAFRARELAQGAQALGTIWFSEGDAEPLRVFVYDAKHHQLTSRTLARPDAAVREEVAVVLRSAISALMAGEAPALEPVVIPPPVPSPPPKLPVAAPVAHQHRALVGLAYAGTTYASGTFQNGLELLVAGQLTSRVLVGLDAVWSTPVTLTGGGAEAILHRYPVELFGGFAFARNPRFAAYAETALQLESVTRDTRVSDPRLMAEASQTRLRFAIAPRLRAVFEPAPALLAFAAFGADITTDRYDYVVQSASGPVRLAARTIRPRLEAGVAVRFW